MTTTTTTTTTPSNNTHYLFPPLLLLNLLLYLEAGAVPALLVPLASQFHMDQLTTGLMGGVVYLTLSLGGPLAGLLLKHNSGLHSKKIIITSLTLNNLSTLFFGLTPKGAVHQLVFSRGLIGFTQVVVCVYSPLWVDERAPGDMRGRFMSYLQGSVPLGVMGGYVLATFSERCTYFEGWGEWAEEEERWRWPFVLQFFMVMPMIVGLGFVRDGDIQLAGGRVREGKGMVGPAPTAIIVNSYGAVGSPNEGGEETERLINNGGVTPERKRKQDKFNSPQRATKMSRSALHKEVASVYSPYKTKDILNSTHDSYGSLTDFFGRGDEPNVASNDCESSCPSTSSFSLPPPSAPLLTCLLALLKSPVYVCLTCSLASLYFTVTGVQYWGTAYMKLVLNGNPAVTSSLFIGVAATGPVMGVFCGGWAVDKLGGYRGYECRNRTMKLCCGLGFASCVFGFPSVFVDDVYIFAGLLWLMLFFGGGVLPGCTGVAVSCIPRQFRPISSSVSLVVFNLFGYSLSLILSGAIMQIAANNIPNCDYTCSLRYGFMSVIFWSLWSLLFLVAAIVFSLRDPKHKVPM
ncbi:hypothetical protein TrST_g5155 [Triparma strigata]|uniref:Major facilitator superfamily (MFS) profile domain-containing protein n=1 Tax=Triparma strigata TaxID=1606541 RepID=A0A9W6ZTZ9_9STRA|nr:hypothetical protein TrST_g5155 [Triparma strigata]